MPRKKKEDASFGPRLTALRNPRCLTQVQLTEATKTTHRSVTYHENGDAETRRLWKRFQAVTQLPEKDQRAVIRLIDSLAAIAAPRRNAAQDERHGR
jgi:hypothetical protein